MYVADTYNNRVRKVDSSGIITTFAGTGTAGFNGDGMSAARAQINGPTSVWPDAAGNVYIADYNNFRIRKVTAAGIISTVAGNGTQGNAFSTVALASQLNFPRAITGDAAGNLYIADLANHRILKVTPAGAASIVAGSATGGAGYSGDGKPATQALLDAPSGVAVDAAGNLYIADQYNRRVRKVTPDGIINTVAGTFESGDGGPAAKATLYYPTALALDANGNLFIADAATHVVRRMTRAGVISTAAGSGARGFGGDGGPATSAQVFGPGGVAADTAGNLYIADFSNNRVRKVDASGNMTTIAGGSAGFAGDGSAATLAQLTSPNSVAVDAAGAIYIADAGNHRIRKIVRGTISTIAGTGVAGFNGDGGQATAAQLSTPYGVEVDSIGNVYIADTNNNRIRRVSPAGVITTVAGTGTAGAAGDGGPAISAQLRGPRRIAIDRMGNLFIPDAVNHRIRMVATNGSISTIAGNGTAGFNGDGGLATLAQLNSPQGVAVDDSGNVFIADLSNHRVRKLTPVQVAPDVVRNGGSLLPGAVSAGEVVIITGTGLGPDSTVSFDSGAGGSVGASVGGTSVLFDGSFASVLSAQSTQVTALVPYGVAGKSSTQIQVEFQGVRSSAVSAAVADTAPGIFTADSSGTGQGVIGNQDASPNSPAQPAARNSLVTIMATGEGQTDPPGVDGKLAGDPAPKPVLPVSLSIGGVDAEVVSYGGVPGAYAGLFQVTARVPAGIDPGDRVSVVLTVGGASSQPGVTMAVQ